VFGFWGLVSLVPMISYFHPPGQSLVAGVLVLGLMVAPTVVLTSLTAIRSVPQDFLRGASALGLGRARYISGIALPLAARGIVGGGLLAAARAIGETMAVLMVCGNIPQLPNSAFDPIRTVTANIALEMGDDTAFHRSVLFLTGLMLMFVTTMALGIAEPFRKRASHG
jgi:phosphate transport system permease protein